MAVSPRIFALPWYARGEYPALLKLFSDPDKLPATYDGWLKRAELTEKATSESRFRCCQDLDSSSSLRSLVQGAERFPRSSGAPDFRE